MFSLAAATTALGSGKVNASTTSLPSVVTSPSEQSNLPAAVVAVQNKLRAALQVSTWPTLNPSVDSLPDAGLADEFEQGCSSARGNDCDFGVGKGKPIAVFGDSLGVALLPVVRAIYGNSHEVKGLTQISCAMTELDVKWKAAVDEQRCLDARAQGIAWIKAHRPSVVMITQNYAFAKKISLHGKDLAAVWIQADAKLISEIKGYTQHIVFVAPTAERTPLADCKTGQASPSNCVGTIPGYYTTLHDAESTSLPAPAKFLDYTELFCVQGYCPSFSGTTPVIADNSHPTKQYAAQLVPAFTVLMKEAGVTG